MRALVALLLVPLALAGCTAECDGHDLEDLVLEVEAADTRSLPLLDSGNSMVEGVRIPDSHGVVRFTASVALPVEASVESLQVEFDRTGPAPVRLTGVASKEAWRQVDGTWQGVLEGTLTLWWSIDPDQTDQGRAMAIPLDMLHEVQVRLQVQGDGCRTIGEAEPVGTAQATSDEARRASTFEEAAPPEIDRADGRGFRVYLDATNDTFYQKAAALMVHYPDGDGGPSVAAYTDFGWGTTGRTPEMEQGDRLGLRHDPRPLEPGPEGSGLYLLVLEVHHVTPPDAGQPDVDLFAFAIEE